MADEKSLEQIIQETLDAGRVIDAITNKPVKKKK